MIGRNKKSNETVMGIIFPSITLPRRIVATLLLPYMFLHRMMHLIKQFPQHQVSVRDLPTRIDILNHMDELPELGMIYGIERPRV